MALWNAAHTQVQIWSAYSRLNAPDSGDRLRAISTLCEIGPAALGCLRFASGPLRPARIQYAAAVAMHCLGDPTGLSILTNALRWVLPTHPELYTDLCWAFITIGVPDAVTALIEVYPKLPPRNPITLNCIADVWGTLRDPRVLEILAAPGWPMPDLARDTIARFGELALRCLERMITEPIPRRRILAIRTLADIATPPCFSLIRPLLADPDPEVREIVPDALFIISPTSAFQAIIDSIRAGHSTAAAVEAMLHHDHDDAARWHVPPADSAFEALLALISRWEPAGQGASGDTRDAVLVALSALIDADADNDRLLPALCGLLTRKPDRGITAGILRLFANRVWPNDPNSAPVIAALSEHIVHPDKEIRGEAANILLRFHDPLGRELNQWLDACWPQGSLLSRLHAILTGSPDAGQVASQTLLQMSQWFNKLSREAPYRAGADGTAGTSPGYDARLPETVRQLLYRALTALEDATAPGEIEELLALCTATIRVLERFGVPVLLCAYDELLSALSLVRPYTGMAPPGPNLQAGVDLVRSAAATLFLNCYGANSYGLFLGMLFAPQPEVRSTAIPALGRLGDPRALPYLQSYASDPNDANAASAQEAIAAIRNLNPDVMVLLRGSQAVDARPDTLLRPANGNNVYSAPDILLRPTDEAKPNPA
jgi:HEAT repeat protein